MFKSSVVLVALIGLALSQKIDYTGHQVLRVVPKDQAQLDLLIKLQHDYNVDFWNEPKILDHPVLFHLDPRMIKAVQDTLTKKEMEYEIVFYDLQSSIDAERVMNAPKGVRHSERFDFGIYNQHNEIVALLVELSTKYPNIAKLETIGRSYENRSIYNIKISGRSYTDKPAIMIDCGMHAREWISVATGAYLVNKLITTYGMDPEATALVDKYEFNIVVEANPDGYVYTWTDNRLWRKTRSHSNGDWLSVCRGVDINRNFDIEHCEQGSSQKPCDDTFCGDKPFSESEARALRDLMINLGSRLKVYFTIHSFSQLWMFPYSSRVSLPPNYDEMRRIAVVGATALKEKYDTEYYVGTLATVVAGRGDVTGSSVDYVFLKRKVKLPFALELRDKGRYGFLLPQNQIIPTCEETFDGLMAAIKTIN